MVHLILKEMKKLITTSILALLIASGSAMGAQVRPEEYLGLPGDNLNLFAVMKLFQESETLEGFERSLNDVDSRINNLDLNGDNMVDYIMVSDFVDQNVHTIVLRTALNRYESQDVAVFTVQRLRNGEVMIQLVGDESLYGKNYIIEPRYAGTYNPGYRGKRNKVALVTVTYRDIAGWPMVRFIYSPAYTVWSSSWYWGYYPVWWTAWNPWYWHYYYGYHYNLHTHYYSHYRHWDHYRFTGYNDHYYGRIRKYSPTVIVNINTGAYKKTYSRPEQRKEGERLYATTLSSRNMNTISGTSNENRSRRTPSQQAKNRNSEIRTTGNAVQVTGTTPEIRGQRQSSTQVNTSSRRVSTTASERPAQTPAVKSNETTVRRISNPVNERETAKPAESRSNVTTRRSAATVSERTVSRPSMTAQRTQPAVSTRSSATVENRENKQISRPAPAERSTEKSGQETGIARRR